jgi:site-specific DNA-methyltransferase (adenine-specific)
MIINTVQNIDFLKNDLPDKCANLIIADPPYFEVKGDFDFIWKTFEDYLKDVEKWAIECKRILADNGTLFWYGDAKKIAYAQIIFDKHFNLISNITCHIHDRQTNKITTEDARSFISTTERILMYSNYDYNNEKGNATKKVKEYLNTIITNKQMQTLLVKHGICSNKSSAVTVAASKLNYKTSRHDFIKESIYDLIEGDKKEYKELIEIFNNHQRPFNPTEQYKMDVLRVSQEGHITGKYDHETVKPEKLTRILITTCSRKGDTLVVPFAGSGTECAMGVKESLKVYGYEITEKHAKMSNDRMKPHLTQTSLF